MKSTYATQGHSLFGIDRRGSLSVVKTILIALVLVSGATPVDASLGDRLVTPEDISDFYWQILGRPVPNIGAIVGRLGRTYGDVRAEFENSPEARLVRAARERAGVRPVPTTPIVEPEPTPPPIVVPPTPPPQIPTLSCRRVALGPGIFRTVCWR